MDLAFIEKIRDNLDKGESWRSYLDTSVLSGSSEIAVHLGVFCEPFLTYILEGSKTIESRFSKNKIAPYRRIASGDILLLKKSSGPVVAIGEVGSAWFYELDPESLLEIKSKFSKAICAEDPEFWTKRASSCYATLLTLKKITPISPMKIAKRDRRGWVILRDRSRQEVLWET